MLFQKNILRKYLATLPAEQIAEAWSTFRSYFLNGVISNFEKLRLYIDNMVEHIEWNLFTLKEQEFREMYLCLAFEQVKQETTLKMKQESVSSEDLITKALYKDYSTFKRVLFADIVKNNPSGTQASRLRESSLSSAASEGTQASRLREINLPSAAGDDGTQASRLRDSSLPSAAGDGTQASRLRDNSQPTAAGETPAYQRDSSQPSTAGDGTQASRLRESSLPTAAGETPAYQRDNSQPSAAGDGTQATRLRDNSLPTDAGETPAYHCRKYLPHIERQPFQFITFRLYDSLPKEAIDRLKSYRESLERFGTQASRLRESSQPSTAGDGTQASRLRNNSLPTAAGEINGTQASRLRDNSQPTAAGEINGTQASRLRDNSLPLAAGETPAYQSELRKLLIVLDKYEDAGYGQCFLRDERIAQIVQNALLHFHEECYELVQWCIMPNHVHVLVKTMPDISISDIMHSWRSFTAHEANMVLGRTGQFWMEEYFDRYIRDAEHFDSTVRYIRNNPVKAGLVSEPEQWPWAGDGTQASRLREINLPSAAGKGTQASRPRDNNLPTDAGKGTQASRLRDNSQPSAAGETPAYQRDNSLPTAAGDGTQASRLRDNSLPSAAGVWYAGVPPAG